MARPYLQLGDVVGQCTLSSTIKVNLKLRHVTRPYLKLNGMVIRAYLELGDVVWQYLELGDV